MPRAAKKVPAKAAPAEVEDKVAPPKRGKRAAVDASEPIPSKTSKAEVEVNKKSAPSKREKRPAEEAAAAVPTKAARTALGRATHQNVGNGLNNNGPLDDQPEAAPAKKAPSKSKAKQGSSSTATAAASTSAQNSNSVPAVLYCFGNNDCGQLGLPIENEKRKFPALVPSLTGKKIIDVACGGMHTIALEENGKVWSFGLNDDKALGRTTPEEEDGFEAGVVELPNKAKAIQITAGDSHSAALTQDGEVFIWGCFKDANGNYGLVVEEGEMCREKPQKITAGLGVKITKIASGAHHIAMLAEDGNVYTCGTGDQGQLGRVHQSRPIRVTRSMGLNATDHVDKREFLLTPAPVKFPSKNKIKDIWTGEFSTYCCAEKGNEIFVFGLNNYSQLGLPNKKIVVNAPTKNTSFKGKGWKQIAAGQHHTVVLDEEGLVYTLGRSNDGRLGLGKVENAGEDSDLVGQPTLVPGLANIKCRRVAAGGSTSYAVTEDGKLYSWGFGENWQLATGDEDDRDTPSQSKGGRDKDIEGEVIKITAGGQHVAVTIKAP